MSPEAQHEAICKAVGYYLIHDEETDSCSLRHPTLLTRYPWHRHGHEQFAWEDGPDWLSDLNALHEEAEKVLTNEQRRQYVQFLVQVHPLRYAPFEQFESDPEANDGYMKIFFLVSATAPQRAEAFLRTLSLWKDSPVS
jgi:hypothetical protein